MHQDAVLYAGEVEARVIRLQVGDTGSMTGVEGGTEVTDDIKSAKIANFKGRAIAIGELCVYMTTMVKDCFAELRAVAAK